MLSQKWMAGAVFTLALLFLALPAFSKDKTAESLWTAAPPAIDGLAEEWSGATFLTVERAGADLAFRNDAEHIYALLIIKDKQHLSSFDATGIFVFLNAEGNKNKDRKLRFYRKAATAQELIQALEKSGQILTEEKKAELLSRKSYVLYQCELVEGKNAVPVEIASSSQTWPPMFKAHADGERTVFEFRFPLSCENQASGIGAVPGGNLKVGFEWGGLTEQMKARRLQGMMAASERNPNVDAPNDYVDRGPRTQTDISAEMKKAPPKQFSFWLDLRLAKAE
jgi:hypothetical protein